MFLSNGLFLTCPTSGLLAVGRCRQAGDLSGANLVRLQKMSVMQAVLAGVRESWHGQNWVAGSVRLQKG